MAQKNTITTAEMAQALDIDFVENFTNDYDHLADLLGLLTVETVAAGTAINQYKITGTLNDSKEADATTKEQFSSGDAYEEGDIVALTKYKLDKVPVGEVTLKPYRLLTTGSALLKGGYTNAIVRTDARLLTQLRSKLMSQFFTFLETSSATSKNNKVSGPTLQAVLAYSEAAVQDTLEDNDDASDRIIHFVNREDMAAYLATAQITTQTLFGMTYLANFLGVTDVFVTNKVPKGTVYATPATNIHAYGLDFATLASAGLEYVTDDYGLIGVHHGATFDRVSVETDAALGLTLVPEVIDYIAKATIGAASAAKAQAFVMPNADTGSAVSGDTAGGSTAGKAKRATGSAGKKAQA